MCHVDPHTRAASPALSPSTVAAQVAKLICICGSSLSFCASNTCNHCPLYLLPLLFGAQGSWPNGDCGNSPVRPFGVFNKSPTLGPIILLSIHAKYLSALLSHVKLRPFEPNNCIYWREGVNYRLVLYYFSKLKVIYKYAECKFFKDYCKGDISCEL